PGRAASFVLPDDHKETKRRYTGIHNDVRVRLEEGSAIPFEAMVLTREGFNRYISGISPNWTEGDVPVEAENIGHFGYILNRLLREIRKLKNISENIPDQDFRPAPPLNPDPAINFDYELSWLKDRVYVLFVDRIKGESERLQCVELFKGSIPLDLSLSLGVLDHAY